MFGQDHTPSGLVRRVAADGQTDLLALDRISLTLSDLQWSRYP